MKAYIQMLATARNTLFAVLLMGLAGCSTLQISLPPVTEAPTNNRLEGKIIWHDLLTNDMEGSQAFYSGLFGWDFEPVPLTLGFGRSSEYVLIRHKGRLIGGMFDTRDAGEQVNSSQWVAVMSVADIDAAARTAETAGGTILTPPTDLAARGRIAVLKDSTGALFALLQTAEGDPLDDPPRAGEFMWNELWTDDIEMAVDFYTALLPFRRVSQPVASGAYVALSINNTPRFGMLENPINGLPPTWAPYLKVDDMAVLYSVEMLGGKVLLPARPRELGGEVALIQGPSGAGIGLHTWPEETQQ